MLVHDKKGWIGVLVAIAGTRGQTIKKSLTQNFFEKSHLIQVQKQKKVGLDDKVGPKFSKKRKKQKGKSP